MTAALDVSRETQDRLDRYVALLTRWTQQINLISPRTLTEIWDRHILDSLQLCALLRPQDRRWVDLGSGGGLPGLVVAIATSDTRPDLSITLIESDQRKAAFLRVAVIELSLSTTVLAARAEQAPPQLADVVSARALAPLPDLLPLVHRHLAPGGRALLPKGRGVDDELAAASAWTWRESRHPSKTDPSGTILQLEGLDHAR